MRAADPLVVTSNAVIADLVQEVAGGRVGVETILSFDERSFDYEPTAEDAALLNNAQLLIINGAGLEPWLDELIALSAFDGTIVECTEAVSIYDRDGVLHTPDEEEVAFDPFFGPSELDPYAWHDPLNVILYVETIGRALVGEVPFNVQTEIDDNVTRYVAELRALHSETLDLMATLPAGRRRLITPYETFTYLANEYGLQVVLVPGLASGQVPPPAAMERLITGLYQLQPPAVFFEQNSNPRALRQVEEGTGAKLVTSLIPEGLGPPGTRTGTYLGMFRSNVAAIVDALQ